jgi:hypothetical protein
MDKRIASIERDVDGWWIYQKPGWVVRGERIIAGMAKKRGYSREFTPQTERRIKREIDRVPPTLDAKVQAKCRRDGISLRALTLTLWRMWADGEIAIQAPRGEE